MLTRLYSADDLRLMKRILGVIATLLVFTAGFCQVSGTYAKKFQGHTGQAQWIWAAHPMSSGTPLAFFAARDFDLPEKRLYTRIKILAEPEYALWVNGALVAERLTGETRTLDQYDISSLVNTGRNRLLVSVRAPKAAGGLIAAVDLAPETMNWLVTDGDWKIYRGWDQSLPRKDLPGQWQPPMLIGEPPVGRWNFLEVTERPLSVHDEEVLAPTRTFRVDAQLPEIRTVEGVAVAVATRSRATAFDFGFTEGRVRLRIERPRLGSHMMQIRFANSEEELSLVEWNLRPVVFAPFETEVTTSEEHRFRYVMVFGRNVTATVLREKEPAAPAQ